MGRIQGIGLRTFIPENENFTPKPASSTREPSITVSNSAERVREPSINSTPRVNSRVEPAVTNVRRGGETALDKPWGYVPPSVTIVKSPAAMGLTPTVAPPLSRMPNPVLQLNSLRSIRPSCSDVGTVGTLRTLRKGGYI